MTTSMYRTLWAAAAFICSMVFAGAAWSASMRVTDNMGTPIAGAQVFMIDSLNNKPVSPTPILTDANGNFSLPKNVGTQFSVSIEADGFIKSSFLNISTDMSQLQLNLEDPRQMIEIQGETTGFGNLPKDGNVDFGLVYPALTRRDLINFDAATLISPEFDTIKVSIQTIDMPSNLTLPTQKETYILPVTLKKPNYRMFVKHPGSYKMIATHGQFPLRKVISDLQGGKSLFEVINHFDFKQAGLIDLDVNGPMTGKDINVAGQAFDATTTMTAPTLQGRQRMISAVAYSNNGHYYATDLKNIESEQSKELKYPSSRANETLIVSALTVESETESKESGGGTMDLFAAPLDVLASALDRVFNAFSLLPDDPIARPANTEGLEVSLAVNTLGASTPSFLGLVSAPEVRSDRIILQQPMNTVGVEPIATYLTLSEIEKVQHGKYETEKRYRLWEIVQPNWTTEISLHKNNIVLDPNKNYRWEVLFLGTTNKIEASSSYFLDNVTHVSRNSRNL